MHKNSKDVFSINNKDPAAYFVSKQLQDNIKETYKVKQSSYYNIVNKLKNILFTTFPEYVIKTDIKSFYETIDTSKLINKIKKDTLLSTFSKKIITNVLHQYREISNSDKGIPRGIGISAYIAEIYMRDFDEYIKFMDDVIFYSRYVDDIIIIFAPKPNIDIPNYYEVIEKYIDKLGLSLNTEKTIKDSCVKFDFLGYKFNKDKKIIELSDNKVKEYIKKIELSFSDYNKKSKNNEKKALLLLKKRIKYLTSNTRLFNSKRNIIVGIYFSNSILNDKDCLAKLDNYLKCKLCNYPPKFKKLEIYSFREGFEKKIFHRFSIKELTQITKVWKYET